ncbi:hypothetical protein J4401_01085 [Candidatus Woesearchaeota archaeon]|nr:hypothetical protein [Candidatus Woesearchaeota archaeon]
MGIFKIIGAIGLLLITVGVIIKERKARDILFIIGGACLTAYSFHIRDAIFIMLQVIFTFAATYDFFKLKSDGVAKRAIPDVLGKSLGNKTTARKK